RRARRDDSVLILWTYGANRRFEFDKSFQLSSARTTKRFPSRCASAVNIVRPRESTAETQPQLQPEALRLSVAFLLVVDHLRRRFAHLDLRAHPLQARSKRF